MRLELEKISCSALKNAKKCERKVYFMYTQPKVKLKSAPLGAGSIFHEVVAEYLRDKLNISRGMSLKELKVLFEDEWQKGRGQIVGWGEFGEQDYKNRCWQYLEQYHQKRLYLLFARSREDIERFFTFTAESNGQTLKFNGKVDLIPIDEQTCVDHKTSKSPWTQQEAEAEVQAHIYPIALNAMGFKIKRFQFNVCTPKDCTCFTVEPQQKVFDYWLNYAFELQAHLADGSILETNREKVCQWCEWLKVCKGNDI